ncbi:MAG: aspartate aminotransferase family protein [Thermoplasmata archaeon]
MTSDDAWRSFRDAPRILHPPPGPRSQVLLAAQADWETDAVVYSKFFPIAVAEARGATIEDVDGNRFLDWVGGVCVLNLGHRHPRLVEALHAQTDRIWHALELPTEARIDFLRELEGALPGKLRHRSRVLFTVTGGDAVETAVSLADFATKRRGTVTFSGAYHGVHGGAASLTSGRRYHATSSFPGGRVIRVPYPDPYRPVLDRDGTTEGTIRYLEHLVNDPYSGVDEVSSVLVEPILGEGGYIVPPDDFLPSLREFCDRHDLLLILDEVQTGLGRTGKMWACEHAGVTPDILCVAKSIGGGIPLSLIAYRRDLVDRLPAGFHLGTYRGNPLALAVGSATLRTLRDDDLLDRTARRGEELQRRFSEIAHRHPSIGDVRGKGFMIGLELVKDAARTPWGDRAKAVRRELFQRGLLMHTCGSHDQVLRFMAPLVIEDELLERGLDLVESSMTALDGIGAGPTAVRRTLPAPPGPTPSPSPWISPPVHPGHVPAPPGRELP